LWYSVISHSGGNENGPAALERQPGASHKETGQMYEYRGIRYNISWADGTAQYTFWCRLYIGRGEGNHGAAKDAIDRHLAFYR
jgi:hypothetical protein